MTVSDRALPTGLGASPPIVGIAVSSAGRGALCAMLGAAKLPSGLAFLVVQPQLAEEEGIPLAWLARHTALAVRQGEGGEQLQADHVYLLPPGRALAFREGRLVASDTAAAGAGRRPIEDVFFSLAADQQANAACVILSGSEAEAKLGFRAIQAQGGLGILQQAAPHAALSAGLADVICPAAEIISHLAAHFARQGEGGAAVRALVDPSTLALEDELRLTRHRLRSTVEELGAANEELKRSNEEMMALNEALQATNEALATVNDALKSKVDQLTDANSDLRNFLESTDLAVVVVDRALCIRSYTEAATSLFPLQPADIGRPLADLASRLQETAYLDEARAVVRGAPPVQRRVVTRDGRRTFSLRILPYRAQQGSTEGASLVLTEISDALSLERALSAERERLDLAIRAGGIGVWEYWPDTGTVVFDSVESKLFGASEEEAMGLEVMLDRVEPEDRAMVQEALDRAVRAGSDFEGRYRIRSELEGLRWVKSFGRLVSGSWPQRMVGVSIDVTPEYVVAETRELMLREMNHRVKNLFAIIGGMVSAAARSHSSVPAFALDIRERIVALGQAHSLASPSGEQSTIDLAALVETTLAPYRNHAQISAEGPPVLIDRNCLSPLALMLHEWATNSVKYGALGDGAGGRLAMRWRLEKEGLVLDWQEESGRTSRDMAGSGFGTLLVKTSARQLGAEVRRSAEAGRYRIELRLPREVVADA